MRKRYLDKLIVEDSDAPVVWAHANQPLVAKAGWRLNEKMSDGAIYVHPDYGLASLRGIEDDAGRKWMHLSMAPAKGRIELADVQQIRRVFFPDRAIVALAIEPDVAELLHMWWAVDGKGLPMDPDWHAMVTPEAEG